MAIVTHTWWSKLQPNLIKRWWEYFSRVVPLLFVFFVSWWGIVLVTASLCTAGCLCCSLTHVVFAAFCTIQVDLGFNLDGSAYRVSKSWRISEKSVSWMGTGVNRSGRCRLIGKLLSIRQQWIHSLSPFKTAYLDRGFRDAIMPRRTVTASGSRRFSATSPYPWARFWPKFSLVSWIVPTVIKLGKADFVSFELEKRRLC